MRANFTRNFYGPKNFSGPFLMHFPRPKNFGVKNFAIGRVQSKKTAIFFCQKSDFFRAQAVQARVRLKKFFSLEVDNVGSSHPKFFFDTTYIRGDTSIGKFGGEFTGGFKIRPPWQSNIFIKVVSRIK